MFKGKGRENPEQHISEVIDNAFKTYLSESNRNSGPITNTTWLFRECFEQLKEIDAEQACSGIKFKLSEGSLREQKERLPDNDPAHVPLQYLIDATGNFYNTLRNNNYQNPDSPDIKRDLCNYLIRPSLFEEDRFATKELLEAHAQRHGQDSLIRDSIRLAECLVVFARPLQTDRGEMRLDDIRDLTQDPKFWLAVLNNVYRGAVALRGTNIERVVDCLRDNYPRVKEVPAVQGFLKTLAEDSDRTVKGIHQRLLGQNPLPDSNNQLNLPSINPFDL